MQMNHIEKIGKRRTILVLISVLIVSLHTIYFYNTVVQELESKKIIQQLIRFLLTFGLLIMVYKGKSWARIISLILFSIGIAGAVVGLITTKQSFILKSPLIVMLIVYTVAVYHFWFSKSFKAFFNYQNKIDYFENPN